MGDARACPPTSLHFFCRNNHFSDHGDPRRAIRAVGSEVNGLWLPQWGKISSWCGVPRFDPGLGVSRRSSLPRYHSPAQQKKKKKNSYAPIFTGPRYTIYHIPHYTSLYIHWVFKVSGQQICIKNIAISRQPLLYLHTPIYLRSYRRNPHIRNVSYSIVKAILGPFKIYPMGFATYICGHFFRQLLIVWPRVGVMQPDYNYD